MAEQADAVEPQGQGQEHEPQTPVGRTLDVDVGFCTSATSATPLTSQFSDIDSALGSETSSYALRTVIVSALLINYQSDNVA